MVGRNERRGGASGWFVGAVVAACAGVARGQAWVVPLTWGHSDVTAGAAWGVAFDGRIAVGLLNTPEGQVACRWGFGQPAQILGDLPGGGLAGWAYGVSTSGEVVVGLGESAASTPNTEAFRWTPATGMQALGDLPGGSFLSQARACSTDGNTVVGVSWGMWGFEAFRWTPGTGMVGMSDLPGGTRSSSAQAVTPDGSIVVGFGHAPLGYEAWRWTATSGMVSLGELPGGAHFSAANGVSADGSCIVGHSSSERSGNGTEAFRWTVATGMVGLGDLEGGEFQSLAYAVSGDGNVVVGQANTEHGREAFIWTPERGMRRLEDALVEAGASSAARWLFREATGVSADGTVIVGYGVDPGRVTRGFLAYLPREGACYANCDGSTAPPLLSILDYICFVTAFTANRPQANCDGGTTPPLLTVADFVCFANRFTARCR